MEYGAIDLHKKESQVRIVTESGEVLDRRIATTRERFTAVFEGRRPMRILREASTESEWVAQHLETLGHEVIVADPTFAPMYSERSRRVKTDRRDVAALADACHRECDCAACGWRIPKFGGISGLRGLVKIAPCAMWPFCFSISW